MTGFIWDLHETSAVPWLPSRGVHLAESVFQRLSGWRLSHHTSSVRIDQYTCSLHPLVLPGCNKQSADVSMMFSPTMKWMWYSVWLVASLSDFALRRNWVKSGPTGPASFCSVPQGCTFVPWTSLTPSVQSQTSSRHLLLYLESSWNWRRPLISGRQQLSPLLSLITDLMFYS